MMKRVFGGTLLTVFVAFGLAACDDATGPGGTGDLSVTLAQLDGSSSAAVSEWSPRLSQVELTSVASIMVTIDRVEVHRAGAEEDDGGSEAQGWIEVPLAAAGEIDLMDLSTASTLQVAEGEGLPADDYDGARLFFTGISITFNADQQVPGSDETIPQGTAVDLTVPSADQTGIKVAGAAFSIADGGATTFDAMWDGDTSVANLTITGTNQVIMAPVLVADGDGGV